jgi:hypothetical protein
VARTRVGGVQDFIQGEAQVRHPVDPSDRTRVGWVATASQAIEPTARSQVAKVGCYKSSASSLAPFLLLPDADYVMSIR